ncbi:DMT family transporter [Desulfovermiculus halophilus]|uniref:DMT family transporter n=1 Tax=Desulfovermiculus halophilus TaxID=339722 RepID=UPI00054F6118|nr:DMT family transporter [Desulfovermiculus halophilus]
MHTPSLVDWKAVLTLTIGAVLISFSAVFVKLAAVGPITAGFYRVLFGGGFLLLFALTQGFFRKLIRRNVSIALICGVVFALNLTWWHKSIHGVGPGLATVLSNFQVFIMAAAGLILFSERLTFRFVLAVCLAVGGLLLLVSPGWTTFGPAWRWGVVFGLLTAVAYASYLLLVRLLQTRQSFGGVVVNMGLVSMATALIMGIQLQLAGESFFIPDRTSLAALLGYGFFSQMVGWILISTALPRVQVCLAGLIILLQPSLAFIWDILFFARPTGLVEMLGACLALTAIYLGVTRQKAG